MPDVSVAIDAGTRAGARDREQWTMFWADAAQSRCSGLFHETQSAHRLENP